jgi:hypothetical protein
VDCTTGEQRLRHDGSATPDGATISSPEQLAYDTRDDRLMVIESRSASCPGNLLAVYTETGALTLISAPAL